MTALRFLFSPNGRTNRAKFWWSLLILYFLALVFGTISARLPILKNEISFNIGSVLFDLIAIYIFFAISAKRWHDQDRSAGWLVFLFGLAGLFVGSAGFWAQPESFSVNRISTLDGPAAWLMLGYFVFAWGTIIAIGAPRGTRGENRYGPDPLTPAGARLQE